MELRSSEQQKEEKELGIMRSSLDYASPNHPDSNKLSSPIRERSSTRSDHPHHHQSIANNSTRTIHPIGVLPPPQSHHQTLDPNPDPNPVARYRECLKNHAASSGGHVLDGCGEFMPASVDPTSPAAMKCAACECHRSFHRKEIEAAEPYNSLNGNNNPNKAQSGPRLLLRTASSNRGPLLQHDYHHHHRRLGHQPAVMMAFGGAESSSDHDIGYEDHRGGGGAHGRAFPSSGKSKRFRTKFKQDQKEKMTEFAERLGWRIQKHDEQEVQRFCSEVGVKRQVFKVWMHNNKQAMKKKELGNNNNTDNNNNNNNNVSKPIINT